MPCAVEEVGCARACHRIRLPRGCTEAADMPLQLVHAQLRWQSGCYHAAGHSGSAAGSGCSGSSGSWLRWAVQELAIATACHEGVLTLQPCHMSWCMHIHADGAAESCTCHGHLGGGGGCPARWARWAVPEVAIATGCHEGVLKLQTCHCSCCMGTRADDQAVSCIGGGCVSGDIGCPVRWMRWAVPELALESGCTEGVPKLQTCHCSWCMHNYADKRAESAAGYWQCQWRRRMPCAVDEVGCVGDCHCSRLH